MSQAPLSNENNFSSLPDETGRKREPLDEAVDSDGDRADYSIDDNIDALF